MDSLVKAAISLRALANQPYKCFWVLACFSAILLSVPIPVGDLPGYDDAFYASAAKEVVRTSDWLNIQINGSPAFGHPPLVTWMQAALFRVFGVSDSVAKLPSAICGFGTILLVYWLGRRLLGEWCGVLSMLVMAGTGYFVKYSARAMTDVPFTFLFTCAVSAWVLAQDKPLWFLAAGAFTGLALISRDLMGLALPVIFIADLLVRRRRPPLLYAGIGLAFAFLPVALWYSHLISTHGARFWAVHNSFLSDRVYGSPSPGWRRYTGFLEYSAMLAKSYWPWLPVMIIGLFTAIRAKDRRVLILVIWSTVVFALCAAAWSRALRYLLPAYPAFAVLSAIALMRLLTEKHVRKAVLFFVPAAAFVAVGIYLLYPPGLHARDVRPIVAAADAATSPGQRVAFYDSGQPRFDEANQMLWYGHRNLLMFLNVEELKRALARRPTDVFVVDTVTYREQIDAHFRHRIVGASGHLVCVLLTG